MARAVAAHNRRFAALPKCPCVYAGELSNGVVKIGYSRTARYRIQSLAQDVKRRMGADLLRFHIISKPTARAAYRAEAALIRALSLRAESAPGTLEFFPNVRFEDVVRLMNAVCVRQPA